jgi:hypothetical protein
MTETYSIMVITLVGFVCFLLGASRVREGDAPVSRAPWFLFRRVADLVVAALVIAVLKQHHYADDLSSQVALLVVISLITSAYGYALGVGGARRSLSIRGDTVMALLAVAPLFNLYLLLAAPKNADKDDVNWLYVAGGLIALLLTNSLSRDIT